MGKYEWRGESFSERGEWGNERGGEGGGDWHVTVLPGVSLLGMKMVKMAYF